MPANKKKKKPTGNPARGFATTSTASKAKPHDVAEDLLDPDPGSANHSSEAPQRGADDPSHEVSEQAERPLHELSPEDLENQLEESTLQLLIDSHGSRMRKDVSRQLARLRTERRILRNQALPLSTREWLPEEIFQLILYRLSEQQKMEIPLEKLPNTSNTDQGKSEDDLLIKLWTLKQLLPQLGFSSETTTSALGHLLKVNDHDDQKALSASKDSIWGLEECFSWLALEAEPEDLPRFEALDVQKPRTRKTKTNGSTTITEARE